MFKRVSRHLRVPKEHGWLQVLFSPALALLGQAAALSFVEAARRCCVLFICSPTELVFQFGRPDGKQKHALIPPRAMLAAGRVLPGVTVSLAQELISVQFTQAGVHYLPGAAFNYYYFSPVSACCTFWVAKLVVLLHLFYYLIVMYDVRNTCDALRRSVTSSGSSVNFPKCGSVFEPWQHEIQLQAPV